MLLASAGTAHAAAAVDIAAGVGLSYTTGSWSANPGDYNKDGRMDLLVGRHGSGLWLFRNTGTGFARVRVWPGGVDRHDCAWGDANGDGRLDFYCSVGGDMGFGIGLKELWLQQSNQDFVEAGEELGIQDPYGRGRWSTFIDVDHDNRLDLFGGNASPRQDGRPSPNRLFLNENGKSFVEAPELGVTQSISNLCAGAVDYNSDGWEDLFVCGASRLYLYRNQQGSGFVDVAGSSGVIRTLAYDAEIADVNADGRKDLVVLGSALRVQLQNSTGSFDPWTVVAGNPGSVRQIATGDFDGDGDTDIYLLRSGTAQDFIYRNSGSGKTYVKINVPHPAVRGKGDTVEALNWNGDLRTEFIVLNGTAQTPGSIQLITWQ